MTPCETTNWRSLPIGLVLLLLTPLAALIAASCGPPTTVDDDDTTVDDDDTTAGDDDDATSAPIEPWIEILGLSGSRATSTAGDFNGDGAQDLLIGSENFTVYDGFEGAAYIFFGPMEQGQYGPQDADVTILGPDQGLAHVGRELGPAGDVDGDGLDDVWVGGLGYVAVFRGGRTGEIQFLDADWTIDQSGANIALTAGDVDSDGKDELFAATYDLGSPTMYYLHLLNLDELPQVVDLATLEPALSLESRGSYTNYLTAGDINGDGQLDLVQGTYFGVLGFYGPFDGPTRGVEDADFEIEGQVYIDSDWMDWAHLIAAISAGGDVNGDGVDDLLAAPYRWYGEDPKTGQMVIEERSYLFLGPLAGLYEPVFGPTVGQSDYTEAALWTEKGRAIVPDVNGDGYDDWISEDPEVFFGGTPPDAIPDVEFLPRTGPPVVGTVGDVTGDGWPDLFQAGLYEVAIWRGGPDNLR